MYLYVVLLKSYWQIDYLWELSELWAAAANGFLEVFGGIMADGMPCRIQESV